MFVSSGSIFFGALGALVQTKIKRFVGYTSINQMGYLLIGVSSGTSLGLQSSFIFLYLYLVMTILLLSILLYVNDFHTGKDVFFMNQLNSFGCRHRNLSIILAIVLFSMAGIPPLAGFFGKFLLLFSAHQVGNYSLVFLGLSLNVVSAFYYLRFVKCMFFEKPSLEEAVPSLFLGSTFDAIFFNNLLAYLVFFLLFTPFFLNDFLFFADVVGSTSQ